MNNSNSSGSLPDPGVSGKQRLLRCLPAVLMTAVSVLCFLVLIGTRIFGPDYSWTDYTYICHALGEVGDTIHYTNTAEAFRINYEKGYRVFEVDLEYTSDGKIVCLHGWDRSIFKKHLGIKRKKSLNGVPMSYDEFMSLTFHGKYPASDFPMICEVLKEHPDAWLVIDGKIADPEQARVQYAELLSDLQEICPESLPHIIPQIYNRDMLEAVREVYPWRSIVYTLYQLEDADTEIREEAAAEAEAEAGTETAADTDTEEPSYARKIVEAGGFDPLRELDFAASHGIGELTISYELFKAHREIIPAAHRKGIRIFVHTVDSGKKWKKLQKAYVDGIYTNRRLD